MPDIQLSNSEKERILRMNWWGHDGRWYMAVSKELGFDKANEMNMSINKGVGKLEMRNLMEVSKTDIDTIKQDLFNFIRLNFDLCAKDVFEISDFYESKGQIILKIIKCAANEGTNKAGYASDYECACFKRVEGWFEAAKATVNVRLEKSLINGDEFCQIGIDLL